MLSSTFELTTSDGHTLFTYKWTPDEDVKVKAIIQIAHGLAEHAGRYSAVAQALCEAGYVVYANDHRGHGRTVKDQRDLGFFAEEHGWERVIADVKELMEHTEKEFPDVPLILLGHSMGSFMAQHIMIEHGNKLKAVVLSGSNGKVGLLRIIGAGVAWLESKRLGKHGRSALLQFMSFGAYNKAFKPARTDFDWLSRDPAEVDQYIADPGCGFVATTGLWRDLLHGLGVIERPEEQARVPKDLPVYIFAGSCDPVSNGTKGLEQLCSAYATAGLNQVTHRYYESGRHEMFNETNREEVNQNLIQWLNQTLSV